VSNSVDAVLFGGDLLHERQKIDSYTYTEVFKTLEKYQNKNFKTYLLLGNHDMWFANNWSVNSIHPFGAINNFETITETKELNILAIFCFQFSFGHPKLIESPDQVFILSQMFNRKRLYEHYASDIYENFEDFNILLDKIFDKPIYNTVVIDKIRNTKITSVNEVVFKYLASTVGLEEYKLNHVYPTKIYKDTDSESETKTVSEKESNTNLEKESDTESSVSKELPMKDIFLKMRGHGVDEPKRKIKIDLKNDNVTIFKDDKEIEITF
jgi:UDP-2,3-diacylglucosamine pyrophosphatase LpxH